MSCLDCPDRDQCAKMKGKFKCPYPIFQGGEGE
jgi:hypothetical protein